MIFKGVPKGHPANVFEAFRQLAYRFGVAELAEQMGIRPGTLYNKADADEDTHHQPTLRDVVLATRLTGDMRVLDALNESFGRAAFDISQCAEQSDDALLELFTDYGSENGEFCSALRNALRARRFTAGDYVLIEAEAMDVVSALMTLVSRVKGLVDE
jgi:hypothetical protein